MEVKDILEAVNTDDAIAQEVVSHLMTQGKLEEVITNKANLIYNQKIGEEVKRVHTMYDNDMFEVLGERPEPDGNGGLEKTHVKLKKLFSELKGYREKGSGEPGLTTTDTATPPSDGQSDYYKNMFETERQKWEREKSEYLTNLEQEKKRNQDYLIRSEVEKGLLGLSFDNSIPEPAVKALVNTKVNSLVNNAKMVDGKVVYFDENGNQINNERYLPDSSENILKRELQDIIKKNQGTPGGSAPAHVDGLRLTTDADGKSTKVIEMVPDWGNSREKFTKKLHKTLIDSGVAAFSPEYVKQESIAYEKYNAKELE